MRLFYNTRMAVTLSEIRTKITETETAISRVKTAASYGKGDKNVQRESLEALNAELMRLRRDEQRLATPSNATNASVLTASWQAV